MLERQATQRPGGGQESCMVPVAFTESNSSLVWRADASVFLNGLQPRSLAGRCVHQRAQMEGRHWWRGEASPLLTKRAV